MRSMKTAHISHTLVAAVLAVSLTLAIVDVLAHLAYPAAPRVPLVLAERTPS
jgi:hypothetical protein